MVRDCVLVVCLLLTGPPAGSAQPPAEREFGHALNLLHEFEYEDANEAFRHVQQLDPTFVPGYWGEAMTYHQSLWRHENVEAGRSVLARLGRTAAERRAKCRTAKEADLLDAAEVLFGSGDPAVRRRKYAESMARAHSRLRDDPDIAALYALSLLATASRGLIGTSDSHEGHSEGLAGSETQARVAAILEAVLQSHPDHRGALHYLLHAYDDPGHAELGLKAARHYATIASASHALHMPSHIFLQLGLWHDAAASDRAAYDASTAWVQRRSLGDSLRNYHALLWLNYELVQLGRFRDAGQMIADIEPIVKQTGQTALLSDLSSLRARFVVEARRWDLLANERDFRNVHDLFAIGMSAARTGHRDLADRARQVLDTRSRAAEEGDLRPAIAIMAQEVAALLALSDNQRDAAIDILRTAARAELQLPAPLGLPEPLKPAPELLGEVLLEIGRPQEAVEWFGEAMKRSRNRSLSVLGVARAAAAAGDAAAARTRYAELLANYDHADDDLPELREARAALQASPGSPPYTTVLALVGGGVILIGVVVFVTRRRTQRPVVEKKAAARGRARRRR